MPEEIRFLCVTGGPGSGKTAVVKLVGAALCGRVALVTEVATRLLKTRPPPIPWTADWQSSFQDQIFRIQCKNEAQARYRARQRGARLVVCDRGRLDGAAYFEGGRPMFARRYGLDIARELGRYHTVIRLITPASLDIGRHAGRSGNAHRFEDAARAVELDRAIGLAWSGHPNLITIGVTDRFEEKVAAVLRVVAGLLPKNP